MTDGRIGIFGGTFDPIHLGHLIIAEYTREELGLDKVLFIPAGQPVFKQRRELSSRDDRLQMVKLATASNGRFEVSSMEVEREGPTYTEDTVNELRSKFGENVSLFLIVGFDSLGDFPAWKNPKRLMEQCTLVAVPRPGFTDFDPGNLEEALPGASRHIITVNAPLIGISASEIRYRVSKGLSIKYVVTEEVERYISQHGLYRGGTN